MVTLEKYITGKQAAELLGLSYVQTTRLIANGTIKAVKFGQKTYMVEIESVQAEKSRRESLK